MNKSTVFIIIAAMASCSNVNGDDHKAAVPGDSVAVDEAVVRTAADGNAENDNTIPAGARALVDAFPDIVTGYADNKIMFADGTSLPYDDGKKKDFDTMLDKCDIEDMFFSVYTIPADKPEYLADAGRARNEAFFKKVYGGTQSQVSKNLVTVPWFGQNVRFTKVNGAADQLRKVAEELAKYPELKKYLKSAGTFYWRKVRGADRLSAHSYGIAIDIGPGFYDYWLWKYPKAKETDRIGYQNRIPVKIAEIFAKHGFVWGGAWYHYDTMHFEYRPEIIKYSQMAK